MEAFLTGIGRSRLQMALSSGTALPISQPDVKPHHPITCQEELAYDRDGVLSCPHAAAPAADQRTQACLDASLAFLLLEEALRLL